MARPLGGSNLCCFENTPNSQHGGSAAIVTWAKLVFHPLVWPKGHDDLLILVLDNYGFDAPDALTPTLSRCGGRGRSFDASVAEPLWGAAAEAPML